jgi:hypothetical protein
VTGVSSPITKRVYNLALDEFVAWYAQEPRPGLGESQLSAIPYRPQYAAGAPNLRFADDLPRMM